MISFQDLNGYDVKLSFEQGHFSLPSKHVLVLVKFKGKWLLTKHPKRGLEFPGGKVETGETLIEAAIRETKEETNVGIVELEWLAEYMVLDNTPFCKTVYIAKVGYIHNEQTSFETEGAFWLSSEEFTQSKNLSFHMKDDGMKAILKKVNEFDGKWND
ncbi:8-oxo-dGTP diphosphatase [Psychrobacillus sp. OK028]|uniref:NUDIX domain-containing protein n=1 Tax=Psychrobacillus sp. OK028 TaxID=1884359 RepID=UPI0008868716|nr:NUDIX domain-containing protein [Psychrobacillus sp. OK028]SDM69799.1 8-oxo-dGTP diphosphatase [Psychrobacillus sp. OK028]